MGRSTLFSVVPEDMRADPAKFKAIIDTFFDDEVERPHGISLAWDMEKMDWINHDQKVLEIFIEVLGYAKLATYFSYDYTVMFEKLFRNLMEQNPQAQKMEWHFICGDRPFCLSINREDMDCRQYAVQIIEGKSDSAHYFDPPAEGETWTEFNEKRYLAVYPLGMKQPKQLVDPKAKGMTEAFHLLLSPPVEPDSLRVEAMVNVFQERDDAIKKLQGYLQK